MCGSAGAENCNQEKEELIDLNDMTEVELSEISAFVAFLPGKEDECLRILNELGSSFVGKPIIAIIPSAEPRLTNLILNSGAQDCFSSELVDEAKLWRSIHYTISLNEAQRQASKSAKQAKRAEAVLQLALNAAETGVWTHEIGSDKITTDTQIDRILGVKHGQLATFQDLLLHVHSDDRDAMRQRVRKAIEVKSTFEVEYRVSWPDESTHNILARGAVFCDSTGKAERLTGICVDETRRKYNERLVNVQYSVTEALSKAESIEEAIKVLIEIITRTLEFDAGELWLIDKTINELRCAELWHKEELELRDFKAISKQITFPCGVCVPGAIWQKGDAIWVEDLNKEQGSARLKEAQSAGLQSVVGFPIRSDVQVIGVSAFFSRKIRPPHEETRSMLSNLSAQIGQFIERKTAEKIAKQALKDEEDIARAILENAPIGVVFLNHRLEIIQANSVFCLQFGLSPAEITGRSIISFPIGLPREALLTVIKHGTPYRCENYSVCQEDGNVAFYDLAIWPVNATEREERSLVLISTDVTGRVKLEKERENFVATLTHDLKNPLLDFERTFELFLNGSLGEIQEEQGRVMTLLKERNSEMLSLIRTLLEVYRYEGGTPRLVPEELNIQELVQSCLAKLANQSTKKMLRVSEMLVSGEPFPIRADKQAIRRVLMNLLDNAFKFARIETDVSIRAEYRTNKLVIEIQDHGDGISASEMPVLFHRFSQTAKGRSQHAGTGLGLYLCRQIVEAHGGEIGCRSEVGIGTIFKFSLPREDFLHC